VCLTFLVCIIITAALGYRLGREPSTDDQYQLRKADFILGLKAAQELRRGETNNALSTIENHCFATAAGLLDKSNPPKDQILTSLLHELKDYRRQFRTNSADWSVMEQRLEKHLDEL
jgi:hypothetical protein